MARNLNTCLLTNSNGQIISGIIRYLVIPRYCYDSLVGFETIEYHLPLPVSGRKTPPAQVAMGETTTCTRGVFSRTAEGETPSLKVAASDNHRKHKMQRSGCKVQRLGPVSARVRTGCTNNMHLQPPLPQLTSSGSARALLDCTM